MVDSVILLVTWFYFGQKPATSQTPFSSMDACQTARWAIVKEASQMREYLEGDARNKAAQGILTNPIIPMVSAVCAQK